MLERKGGVHKYEAMVMIKPDLSEEDKKTLFSQIADSITKQGGSVTTASVWAEKRKLIFSIKRHTEATYYLVNFVAPPQNLASIRQAYRLNEFILRALITRLG